MIKFLARMVPAAVSIPIDIVEGNGVIAVVSTEHAVLDAIFAASVYARMVIARGQS